MNVFKLEGDKLKEYSIEWNPYGIIEKPLGEVGTVTKNLILDLLSDDLGVRLKRELPTKPGSIIFWDGVPWMLIPVNNFDCKGEIIKWSNGYGRVVDPSFFDGMDWKEIHI